MNHTKNIEAKTKNSFSLYRCYKLEQMDQFLIKTILSTFLGFLLPCSYFVLAVFFVAHPRKKTKGNDGREVIQTKH